MNPLTNDTIIALATAAGVGAIAVIRLSGPQAISKLEAHFESRSGKQIGKADSHTVHLGHLVDGERTIDEVLVTVFRNPNSYTGEDVVEISCHGSRYIQKEIIQLFLRNGLRHANPGEFTLRAFLNGKMDLSQAEAVADLIASKSEASHRIALKQMRGGFSGEIEELRKKLLNFASLIELELDFAEEDVEFADRTEFSELLDDIRKVLVRLIDSFALGNVLKNGIPVAITGEPNVGKSTLLNALLNEEKALVSDIAGTTRDAIEDEIILDGVAYRFIDTAGIRQTEDVVETMGIQRTFEKMASAQLLLHLLDLDTLSDPTAMSIALKEAEDLNKRFPDKQLVIIGNKADLAAEEHLQQFRSVFQAYNPFLLSAKKRQGIDQLVDVLTRMVSEGRLGESDTLVSNARHYEALTRALTATDAIIKGLEDKLSSDLMAIDVRQALYHLGEITGEVTTDDLLGNIFANFCIGK